jgi:BirA family biotin operon repressor/biotin-[acetyl-CoA-carboxylase] ligase
MTDSLALAPFEPTRFERYLSQQNTTLGRPCHYLAVTGSTNDDLMTMAAQGAPHGTLVVADLQTQGRGRQNNRWSSPRAAENLLFSVLLRPNFALETVSSFTLAVGLALRDALARHVSVPLQIKWTNDLYAKERKLAGILVESTLCGNHLSALVVGIGLNVHMTKLPQEISSIATSLAMLETRVLDRELLLAQCLKSLEVRATEYERSAISGIIAELREHDAILDKRVTVGDKQGIARGLDDDGALLLETVVGQPPERLTTGLVVVQRQP